MEENRFLRCVAEHRASRLDTSDRFRRFVAEERGYIPKEDRRPWDISTSPTVAPRIITSFSPAPTPTPTPTPTTESKIVYYSPNATANPTATPVEIPRRESIEERYARTVAAQRALATPQLPTSPLVVPRKRQDSSLSLMSEESFPSLPSGPKSTPTTPQQRVMGWSDALRKNLENSTETEKRPRFPSSRPLDSHEEWVDEEDLEEYVEYDEDGFPHMRYRYRR